MEITLALIKPHAYKNISACSYIGNQIINNFNVLEAREINFTKDNVKKLYEEHQMRFFYNRLLSAMTSGPCFALVLLSKNSIMKWRTLMGSTKVYAAVYENESIRSLYGLSDTRNACHGADSPESVIKEIELIFPDFQHTYIKNKNSYSQCGPGQNSHLVN